MTTIRKALNQLKDAAFPYFPTDDALSTWVGELAEFDGYIAGLATSAIGGGQVDFRRLNKEASQFLSAFAQFPKAYPDPEDNQIYMACERYLEIVEEVINALNEYRKV